jgi:hypothetical protein
VIVLQLCTVPPVQWCNLMKTLDNRNSTAPLHGEGRAVLKKSQ